MNNLKRVLSLGLAGTMLTGMMAIGASAAEFTDADQIVNDEAVNILVALNVVDGKPGGIFDPQGTVTRGEMAKMIAATMNGGNDTNTGVKTNPTFTDIKGRWAESYIEYCADMKIISGRGDGTFDPNGEVTGLEATKMVLTALGYDATAYKLVGNTWAVRTDELARTADPNLYENLESVMMANNATRETAAQLIWNGLQNKTVTVSPSTNTSSNEVTWNYSKSSNSLLNQRFAAYTTDVTFNGNWYTDDASEEGEIDLGGTDFEYDFDISYIGEEVKVVYKNGKNANTALTSDDTILGVFPNGDTSVERVIQGDVKDLKSTDQKIKIGSTKYDVADSVDVVTNFTTTATYTKASSQLSGSSSANSKLTDALKAATGSPMKLVFNSDNEITKIYITESKLAKVSAISSDKITLSGVGSIDLDQCDVYEGVAKNDIVVVTQLYKSSLSDDKAFVVVAKPEIVSGTVKSFVEGSVASTTESITLTSGETYDVVKSAAMETSVDNDARAYMQSNYIGEDFDLYLVDGYVAAAVQTTEALSNYSVVIDAPTVGGTIGSAIQGVKIRVMDADGTKTVLTLSDDCVDVSGNTITTEGTIKVGDIVTWSVNKDGEADVTVEATATSTAFTYNKNTKAFSYGGKDYKTASDSVFFYTSDAANTTYKVANLRDLNNMNYTKDLAVVLNSDGTEVLAVYAKLGLKPSGATSNTLYGIVSKYVGRVDVDGSKYYQFIVDVNADQYTVNLSNKTIAKGDIVKLEPTTDDIYTSTECAKVVETKCYVYDFDEADTTITIIDKVVADGNGVYGIDTVNATKTVYAYDEDTNFFFVDADNDCGVDGVVTEFNTYTGKANAIVFHDSDNIITDIIIEVSGEADII